MFDKKKLVFAESIINTVRGSLVTLDQDLKVVTANRSFYELFKFKPENTIGTLFYEIGNKQWDVPILREMLVIALLENTNFDHYEFEYDCATIGKRTLILDVRQIEPGMLKKQIVLLSIEDITERKKVENALIKSEENLSKAQAVTHFASWELDISSGDAKWSDEQYRILGLEPGEISPAFEYYLNAINKEDQAYTINAVEKALAGECDYDVEYRVKPKNGKERVVHAQATLERDASGNPFRLIGTSHDITERKQLEQEINDANKEEDKRADELVFANEEEDKRADELVLANKELAYQNQEKDKRADELVLANEEKDKRADELVLANEEKDKRADELVLANIELAYQNREKDKRADELVLVNEENDKRADELVLANEEKDKRADELVLANEEKDKRADELVLANKELVNREASLQEANAGKSRFLAAASHDLRQPLQSLGMYFSVMTHLFDQPGQLDPQKLKEIGKKMRHSLNSMGEMLASLLDISKLDGGVVIPEKRNVELPELLDRIIIDNVQQANEKGLQLVRTGEACIVHSDPGLLKRIIENFVTNAVRYTERGSITIDCQCADEFVRISVIDTGVGIPEDEIDKVFEEYYQLNNTARDRRLGLGLGLSIVKLIGGILEYPLAVSSILSKGSTFAVDVPLGKEITSVETLIPKKGNSGNRNIVVLLVEDDPSILNATAMLLQSINMDVYSAVDGDAAMAHLSGGVQPTIVVSDYRLPGYSGIEVIRRVRQVTFNDLPAILVTGDTSSDEIISANMTQCTVLHKPTDADQLIALIKKNHFLGDGK